MIELIRKQLLYIQLLNTKKFWPSTIIVIHVYVKHAACLDLSLYLMINVCTVIHHELLRRLQYINIVFVSYLEIVNYLSVFHYGNWQPAKSDFFRPRQRQDVWSEDDQIYI